MRNQFKWNKPKLLITLLKIRRTHKYKMVKRIRKRLNARRV